MTDSRPPAPPAPAPWAKHAPDLDEASQPLWIKQRRREAATGAAGSDGERPGPGAQTSGDGEGLSDPLENTVPRAPPSAEQIELVALRQQLQSVQDKLSASQAQLANAQGRTTSLEQQIASLVRSAATMHRDVLEASERDLVQLAMVIAERVVKRELRLDPRLVADWARQGVEAIVEQDEIEVVVSPDVATSVPAAAWTDARGQPFNPTVDPGLPPGSCELRGELSRVEVGLAARMAAMAEALGLADDKKRAK